MERLKILVVDDESRMRKLVRDFLEREGFRVLEASDGAAAMELFYEDKDIALIILDVMMPNMDGCESTQAIRALDRPDAKAVPIIALSANAFEEDVALAKDAGMNEHLAKPVDIGKMLKVMSRLGCRRPR